MKTYSLENRPRSSRKALKATSIQATLIPVPFFVETQEGIIEYSPDLCDDWGEGYILAYPSDGSKPYAMSHKYFEDNYRYV